MTDNESPILYKFSCDNCGHPNADKDLDESNRVCWNCIMSGVHSNFKGKKGGK